ncbi:hypothetical protein [Candidatus Magnetobacterium casense]|uniref:Uncharacterized protein n=1 Tax=Candidatus Magnetobacterium casense TaxID=1455061 RepID=A0ABS6S301_9BACT|nr:hypothetical protein [Candidatus Magnetobacterium casensis]MBV6343230.1 hypothetical protein [Candidatus Magnetobacterium casensis]
MIRQLIGAGIIGVAIGIGLTWFVLWLWGIIKERDTLKNAIEHYYKPKDGTETNKS